MSHYLCLWHFFIVLHCFGHYVLLLLLLFVCIVFYLLHLVTTSLVRLFSSCYIGSRLVMSFTSFLSCYVSLHLIWCFCLVTTSYVFYILSFVSFSSCYVKLCLVTSLWSCSSFLCVVVQSIQVELSLDVGEAVNIDAK